MKDKKTLIFEAALEMISSGIPENEMTISAIAKKAGIGKGTVYEYFSSKAELLIETVNFFIDIATRRLTAVVSTGSFREQFFSFLKQVGSIIDENERLFSFLFLNQDVLRIEFERKGFSENRDKRLLELLEKIVDEGQREKLLRENISQIDIIFSFISVSSIMNFSKSCRKLPKYVNMTKDELFEYCYEMFVRILS
jgi:AcrR family transcriptional regulator